MNLNDDIEFGISTVVFGEDNEPKVILELGHIPTGEKMHPLAVSPVEAISLSGWLMQAAEVAVSDAALISALRSRKMPDDEISDILSEIRGKRMEGVQPHAPQ